MHTINPHSPKCLFSIGKYLLVFAHYMRHNRSMDIEMNKYKAVAYIAVLILAGSIVKLMMMVEGIPVSSGIPMA